MSKFWIVEYVDVSAPRAQRIEICANKSEARHRAVKREAIVQFCELESFAERGLCDYIQTTHLFDNVSHA